MDVLLDTKANGITVVQPQGRLDLLSAAEVKQRLVELVAQGHRRLVVALDSVTFIDSSGLGALIGALKAARIAGGDLRIAQPNSQALSVLKLTTLDRVLRPYATLEEAFAGY